MHTTIIDHSSLVAVVTVVALEGFLSIHRKQLFNSKLIFGNYFLYSNSFHNIVQIKSRN